MFYDCNTFFIVLFHDYKFHKVHSDKIMDIEVKNIIINACKSWIQFFL